MRVGYITSHLNTDGFATVKLRSSRDARSYVNLELDGHDLVELVKIAKQFRDLERARARSMMQRAQTLTDAGLTEV